MKFNDSNLYIEEHGLGYTLNIRMPDGSRNYLHTKFYRDLMTAIFHRDELIKHFMIWNNAVIGIIKDEKYYRIIISFEGDFGKARFHSRKLNLNDAIYERMQLLVADD